MKYKKEPGFAVISICFIILIALPFVLTSQITQYQNAALENRNKTIRTYEKLKIISQAIKTYYKNNNSTYPLPGSPAGNISVDTTGYAFNNSQINSGGIYYGSIAFNNLGLPPSYSLDEWGNKISYYIKNTVDINYVTDTNSTATTAPYVLISHGPDGLGSYRQNGSQQGGTSATTQEINNYYTSSKTNSTSAPFYISANGSFGDIGLAGS
jgi:hypothetical protein